MAWCSTFPHTPANLAEFGRSGNEETPSPFPQVRIVGLAQCGTHAVVDAARGPITIGEQTLTAELIPRLQPGMLVTADRNFCLQLSGLAGGIGDRCGAVVAGLGEPDAAGSGVAARRVLPFGAHRPQGEKEAQPQNSPSCHNPAYSG